MNISEQHNKPEEAVWRPLTGLPDGAVSWSSAEYDELVTEWHQLNGQITDKALDRTILDIWLTERRRAFAIETGQIEGLYTLKRGVTEQLITEGLGGAVSSHTVEGIDDKTIKGLLTDQEMALEVVFDDIKHNKPLGHFAVKSWHQLLTRHQKTVTGLATIDGKPRRVQRPFKLKGQYKIQPNNPVRHDGVIHEYCPPEHVQSELDRLFGLYADIRQQHLPTQVEAAWLHHRFVRTHPFQDGNGRVSRLLMAYVYLRKGEAPPIITIEGKGAYILALENADRGNLKAFSDHLLGLASVQVRNLIAVTKNILSGHHRMTHANGGITDNGTYYPPDKPETDYGFE